VIDTDGRSAGEVVAMAVALARDAQAASRR
jgi:hypothetical protein